MARDPYQPVQRGQRVQGIPRDLWNAVASGLRERDTGLGFDSEADELLATSTVIQVRNKSGVNLDRFTILEVDVPSILPTLNLDEFREQIVIDAIAPTGAGNFVVLFDALLKDDIGRAIIAGVTPVKLRVPTTLETFCDAESGVTATLLTATTGSARVLWAETSGTERWALVRFPDGTTGTGGAGTPGGSVTQVQFHDTGAMFGGDSGFTYDKTNNTVTITSGATTARQLILADIASQTVPALEGRRSDASVQIRVFNNTPPGAAPTEAQAGYMFGTTIPSGLTVGSTGEYFGLGINNANIGVRDTAKVGGYFVLDIRGGNIPYFQLVRNAVSGSDSLFDMTIDIDGKVKYGAPESFDSPYTSQVNAVVTDAGTNTIANVLTLGHRSTGTPAAGLGSAGRFEVESSTTNDQVIARVYGEAVNITHATLAGKLVGTAFYTSTERAHFEGEADSGGAVFRVMERFALPGDISPAQLTGNQTDYNPTGLAGASVLRLTSDAARTINSLAGGADGRVLLLHNVGSQNILLLDDDGATGTASMRFALNATLTMAADNAVGLQYDSTSSRWRALFITPGGAGSGITTLNTLTAATQTFTNDTNVTIVSGGSAHVITWAGTLATARIANDAVTYAKMQDISAGGRVIGRSSGAGDPEEITMSNGVTLASGSLQLDINGLTEDTAPDLKNDFLATYDASASGHKKIKLKEITPLVYSNTTRNTIDGTQGATDFTQSYTIPASDVAVGDMIRATYRGQYEVDTGPHQLTFNWTGSALLSGAIDWPTLNTTGLAWALTVEAIIIDASSTGSYQIYGELKFATSASTTAPSSTTVVQFATMGSSSIDWSVAQDIKLRVTWANASVSDKLHLDNVTIEHLRVK